MKSLKIYSQCYLGTQLVLISRVFLWSIEYRNETGKTKYDEDEEYPKPTIMYEEIDDCSPSERDNNMSGPYQVELHSLCLPLWKNGVCMYDEERSEVTYLR